jgi:precorrin-2 dehydrogenase / sirohydrochlorin ferrochelatase
MVRDQDMPSYYPVFVNLQGKRCLVVGGGEIATRKVHGLLEADALVVVISPTLSEALAGLAAQGIIEHQRRPFRADDVLGCTLVIGATDQPEVNRAVCKAARKHHVWVNIVDVPDACDFIAPAVVRRGALQVAISTGGHSPTLAKRIRLRLEESFGAEYAVLLENLGRERERVRRLIRDPELRKAYFECLVDTALSKLNVTMWPARHATSHPLQGPHPGAEIVHQRDDDQRHQQEGQELLVMEEADGHVDITADPTSAHHPDDGGGANIHLPAIQGVGDQLR